MKNMNFKNFLWNKLKNISNLSFAISILIIIACLGVLGSIIEQDQSIEFYQNNYPIYGKYLFFFNWQIIVFLGLDHIYATWWFQSIIILFSICLTVCTFSIQLPSLKYARRWKFKKSLISQPITVESYIEQLQNNHKSMNSIVNMLYALSYNGYYLFSKHTYIYAYKGLIGRISPIVVHFSIILTLIGCMTSILTGLMTQEMISEGEFFHFKNVIHAGNSSYIKRNVLGRVNNFSIEYNHDTSIKQFFSDISLIDNKGKLLTHKVISVNSPLSFQGLMIYQTDWNIDGIKLAIGNNHLIQKSFQKVEINNRSCWLANFIISDNEQFFIILFSLQENMYIYLPEVNKMFPLFIDQHINIKNIDFTIKDILVSTGLQIKIDKGISFVYLGFFLTMVSTVISYLSYSQVWIMIDQYNKLSLSGSTNRAILFFEEEINKIQILYNSYIKKI